MVKIKNVSGSDRTVPGLGGRLILAGAVVDVPEAEAESYLCQEANWAPVTVADATNPNKTQEG